MKVASLFLMCVSVSFGVFAADMAEVLSESGVTGGIVVHIGCDDPGWLLDLCPGTSYVVHGLDTDAGKIEAAREFLSARKVYGRVSVSLFDGEHLPYIDNLVNLVVVDKADAVSRSEVLRVLAPLGVVWIDGKKFTKPWPQEIDEWPQYLHGADNNAVSKDTIVGPPRHMQWATGPVWSRSHMAISTFNTMVTAQGRMFTIEDKATPENPFLPARFSLVARDAFNGVVLWEHPFSTWESNTRYIKDIALQLQRRLAAIDDKVYCTPAISAPITQFDAGTGKVLKVYKGTDETQEFAYHNGTIYAVVGDRMNAAQYNIVKTYSGKGIATGGTDPDAPFDGHGFKKGYAKEYPDLETTKCDIVAIDADTGNVIWKESDIENYIGVTLALKDDLAVYMTNGGLKCLNARTGEPVWAVEKNIVSGDGTQASTMVISDDAAYTYEGKQVVAYSLKDGHEKWSSGAKPNYEKSADIFVVDGVVWTGGTGPATSHDPLTGEPTGTIKQLMLKPMSHDRCYRNFITEKYFINSKTGGADFLDLDTGSEFPNHWVRGTCGVGVLPANGMLYAPPYSCQCSSGAMIKNFNALYTEPGLDTPDQMIAVERKVQLIKGPAFGKVQKTAAKSSDWPVYRKDNTRGGTNDAALPGALTERWKVEFAGTPSAPIVAAGKVFVADIDAHTVHAINAGDGNVLWSYVAGGRVDSPPAYYEGLILFGSRDGWVHCVRADDGALVWTFRDLPDKLIGAFGQLESAWPVNGSVLLQDDTVYFAAGRSSFLDGGIFIYALDPRTGEVKTSRRIYGPFDEATGFPAAEKSATANAGSGFKGDIMVSDGETIYMRHKAFTADLASTSEAKPHLIPSVGFIDGTPQHRTYWTFDTKLAWTKVSGIDTDIMAVDGERFYGVQGFPTHRHSYFDPRKSGYKLFAGTVPGATEADQKKARRGDKKTEDEDTGGELWTTDIPLTGKAMIKAGDTLCIAGTPMKFAGNPFEKFVDSYEQRLGGVLWLASAKDGAKIAEYKLDAAPAWDGMAAVKDRLFISMKDGSVRCFSTK